MLNFYIDGAWVAPAEPNILDVINPATEAVAGHINLGGLADVNLAVAAAKRAFRTYSRTSRAERLDLLASIISAYEKRMGDVAAAITDRDGRADPGWRNRRRPIWG
jgi:aldehyde dehydrogenase (NAD+)